MLTTKKVKAPTVRNALIEYQVLDEGGTEVARIYKRQISKTGFKRGRSIGQVKVTGWFYQLTGDEAHTEFGVSPGLAGGPKWTTLAKALDGLTEDLSSNP